MKNQKSRSDMKRCFKCRKRKPLGEFYRHPQMGDGRLNKCKECTKDDVQANRAAREEYYRLFDAWRARTPERREWRRRQPYDHTHQRAWIAKNRDKRAAHVAVGNAIRDGRLKRQPCEECGATKAQGHHDDYSKPLDVRWLCSACHGRHHWGDGPQDFEPIGAGAKPGEWREGLRGRITALENP